MKPLHHWRIFDFYQEEKLRNTAQRFFLMFLFLLALLLAGTLGYHLLLDWPLMDGLYMTVISLTTVGFGEVHHLDAEGRWFTMALILSGVGFFAYTISTMATLAMEVEFNEVIWRRRMQKRIDQLNQHIIVCGYGRTGRAVCDHLHRIHHPFVVLESQTPALDDLREKGYLFIDGDATHDDSLHRAGIARARSLVAALGNDAENVYLTLSAHQFNAKIQVASWASSQEAKRKLLRAGADYVVTPYETGGQRLVHHLVSPNALAILDTAIRGESPDFSVEEVEVKEHSKFVDNSLRSLGIGRDLGVIIIGIRRKDDMLFNPSADTVFHAHDILVGIGSKSHFIKLRNML